MPCWKPPSWQSNANPEGPPSSVSSLLCLLALDSFFWVLAVQNSSSHIRVGTGLLSWCQIIEQIEKKWASPGVIKLFDIFIQLSHLHLHPPCAHHLFPSGYSCSYLSSGTPVCCLSTHLPLGTLQTKPYLFPCTITADTLGLLHPSFPRHWEFSVPSLWSP